MNGAKFGVDDLGSEVSYSAPRDEENETQRRGKSFLGKLSYYVLMAALFLLPVLVIPSVSVHFAFTKQLIFASAVLVAFAFFVLQRLKDGTYELPTSLVVLSGGGVVLALLLSSLFSGSVSNSILGQGFETGSFLAVFIGFLAVLVLPLYFKTKDTIFSALVALMVSFVVVALFEISRFAFGPNFLSMGYFTDITSNPIGQWNDLGVFFGLFAVLSWITSEFFDLGNMAKVFVYAILAVSLFFVAVVSFPMIWYVLALIAVILVVYLRSTNKRASSFGMDSGAGSKRWPIVSVAVGLLALIMIIPVWQKPEGATESIRTNVGSIIGSKLATSFNINQIDVRPSWQSTMNVAKQTLKSDPILGSGPNRFASEWLKYKDPSVNSTIFWGTDFNFGIGTLPTFIVTSGLLGTIAWLFFIGCFLYVGFRSMFVPVEDKTDRYLVTMSFLGALFLWIFNLIYAPGNVVSALTFITTGLFVASLVSANLSKMKSGEYTGKPKLSFATVLVLIFTLVVAVTAEYFILQRYIAYVQFQKGVLAANGAEGANEAEAKIASAAKISENDLFYRALTELGLIKLNTLLSESTTDKTPEAIRTNFQNLLGTTLNHANRAIEIDKTNYANWLVRGRVYELIVPLKIEGAYNFAKTTYEEAIKINPHNPAIYLMLARLESTNGNNEAALSYIDQALKEKANYTDAVFMKAQIEIAEGKIKDAIKSVESAAIIQPNDPTILFQLGFLKFNDKDYTGAIQALEDATRLNPIYANAKYFLGLAYEKMNRDSDAIKQFTELKETNPDNAEIDLILSNLKAGKAPFSDAADSQPEKRTKPPVEESKTSAGEMAN
ncbi:MAG: hypothetical protein A3H57_04990 [Candidatus Taylorbacteria bacterium RIFCSPLOWO2_02_FULL_43_11]|uniref:Uncharacterized protein n=1 Tax=Candidatus Taylorbacteria bacterium RIFCSPHIGHO2_02_FULL_43_32b TaxID=1802306 RepID=A0A1G2MJ49_9BACT|nr:MAG: hypothetical protein A2743_02090 [Candidatus Taylorbacteria bacterium RIFCSPHIGHO2_01_FULL_43_47]OHA23903.1 MAG: hypothetical protein A3C72_01555 [Candidatus Taylorbacteria bacterium RIFCSPHIGHO2_02_FULL_43_32b]OHA30654.1 MAG: hypothetical protein A3B08_03800 [Candidatus Taylorbacteria bacterium RIFCSPLOWO2_01_FULL_43_44]OHA37369.1 MAG: hypothetical protein A3H57_04990 [Candidatus Taylorbacteria bacterium RIFCSPLOWO2_02_FULL_43_11]